MLDNKRAQIGETMTWVIATLVIVVILSISIFFTFNIGKDKEVFSFDKEKDFLATVSITNFLSDKENFQLIDSYKEDKSQLKIEKFLSLIPVEPKLEDFLKIEFEGSWVLEIGDGEISKTINQNIVSGILFAKLFNMEFEKENLKLNFWAECPTTCK